MKMTSIRVIILLSTSFFLHSLVYGQSIPDRGVKKGWIDLRMLPDFREPISLGGDWGFFWKQLLPADSFPKPSGFIQFPSLWSENRLCGKPIPSQGYASYTLTILLPKQRPRLGLEVPDTYCAYQLYVNGVLQIENGKVGSTASSSKPFWAARTIALAPEGPDTLHLLFQVANYWHDKGGTYKEMLIGDKDQLFLKKNREASYDLFLTGCLFMGGLFFLGLYLFGRKDKAILYFSLFCILYSYRMIGSDGYVLHTLFLDLNWFVTIRIEYLSLSLGVALFIGYTRELYPADAHHLVMKIAEWFCCLFSVLIIFTSTLVFTRFLTIFLGSMFLFIAYALFVYFKAALNKRSGSMYALLSSVVVLLIFLLINLNYFGLLKSEKGLVFIGYIAFFFLQSLALSYRFAQSFRLANLQAQQGLRAKSEFLSTMSHEIRTPLNAVIGITHLLLRNQPRKDQEKNLNVLLFSTNNLLSIVNNILDYNKIEEGKISFEHISMDLASIAGNIVAGFKTAAVEKGIDLQLISDEKLDKKLMGDPTRIAQVITNLVHNAIKFTEQGWVHVNLQVSALTAEAITVKVSVEDTGIGIAPEKQQLIFERFTQADSSTSRSYGGTGLGLSISQKILELQGSKLQLRSEPGRGAVFYFSQTFAVNDENIVSQKLPREGAEKNCRQLEGLSILLVEDNPLNILIAQTILENGGALIDVATNGQEALDIFNPGKHSLILMDLHMPVMDGYAATELLRGRGETLPIIALTANTIQEVEGDAYVSGLTDIVVKPFNPENLYRVILQHVRPAVQ
jgi:signal transduction histidine kinase/ActR/RegA family two-component response regulator